MTQTSSASLPLLCDAPPAGFPPVKIKSRTEDFIVEEMPLYEPSGSGTHTYLWIEKRQANSLDAARKLAGFLGKRAADVGVAGLKDAQAVTRQWISFEHVVKSAAEILQFNDPALRVLSVSRHGNKLKMGHLRGNRFILRMRLDTPGAEASGLLARRAGMVLDRLWTCGVPNYFGPQRFGRAGDNVLLGRLLVQGHESEFQKCFLERHGNRRPADRKLRNLLVNAFQADLFNRVLAVRMPNIGRLQAGDIAWLHRNGAAFAIGSAEEAAREQVRADNFEISPSGPLFGPRMLQASHGVGELESRILNEAGVSMDDFGRKEAEKQVGARRPLRFILLEKPVVESDADGVLLRLALPSGAYASVVLREITGDAVNLEV
jgi:tRNA pseudouridine13 synthase